MSDEPTKGRTHDPEEEIFAACLARPIEERARYLDQVCAGDAALRHRVEELLRSHSLAESFLEEPPVSVGAGQTIKLDMPLAEKVGDHIGRYKLLQQIGEGGCGVVYMAEQEEPVKRRVALKVIKLGMDTKSVIARFEAERQALALMDHPNIAKVFDAGATDKGRPYFVMELVRGIKITDYCDQNNLPTKSRLDLFVQVCRAVQHAHQKGIIHRDIKPSNILVTMHDGVPVPKVIDFGIAKATQGKLTDHTLFTAFEQFIGTPAYMSPEQAEMSALDIDTRSDLYSLGVLLYELLTGKTPFDPTELMQAGLDEMRRQIREKEPTRPSTRLSTMLAADLTTVAAHRQSAAPKLVHMVKGDLDWIVMKCLEKDRTRRYETANGLALDIQRHLNNEPVTAAAPSATYRLQKFVRRHRTGVLVGSVLLLTLVTGIVGTTWGMLEALHQKREAERQKQEAERQGRIARTTTDFLTGMFESIDPAEAKLREITVREVLDQASGKIATAFPNEPMTELPIRRTMIDIYSKIAKPDEALAHADAALRLLQEAQGGKDSIERADSLEDQADCLDALGKYDKALPLREGVLALRRMLYKGDNTNVVYAMVNLANCLEYSERPAEALPIKEAALAMVRRVYKGDHPDVALSLFNLGVCFDYLHRPAEALTNFEAALAMHQRLYKEDRPEVAHDQDMLSYCLFNLGRPGDALPHAEAALAMNRRIHRGDHPFVAHSLETVAGSLYYLGRSDEALTNLEASLAMYQRIYKGDHPKIQNLLNDCALALDAAGRSAEALPKAEEGLAMCLRLNPGDRAETANDLNNCAFCLEHLGRWSEALPKYEAALAMSKRLFNQDDPNTALFNSHVGDCLWVLGRADDAMQKYQEALAMFTRLAAAQPGNNLVKAGLGKTRYKLGDLWFGIGKTEEAHKSYQDGLDVAEAILASDPANPSASKLRLGCRLKLGVDKAEVVIRKISPGSLAQEIGLREGDVLVRYAGQPLLSIQDLPMLTGRASGSGIELEIRREGAPLKLAVKAGPLGVIFEDRIIAGNHSP
jgi:tetratricopeptide (TPR) repeat protein/tRNA A-37 threonylcarbamoyl transferase component Bud32